MRIFLTGGTGFIGHHVARRLLQAGHQLRCLARTTSSRRNDLRAWGVELVDGDVTDRAAVEAGLVGCQAVVHLAGLYAMWQPDRPAFEQVNVTGTRTVLEAALARGVRRVIYMSTVAVYGRPQERPFCEDSQPGPRWFSEYGRSKAAADRLAWELAGRGLDLTAFYPGIVLGAGDDKASGHYIRDLIGRRCPSTIYHHSSNMYVYVGDVALAVERALERPRAIGQKYLLGAEALDGQVYTQLISQVSGVALPWFRFPDWLVTTASHLLTWRANLWTHTPPPWGLSIDAAWTLWHGFVFDGSKAVRELGIRYTPIRRALEEAVASYQAG